MIVSLLMIAAFAGAQGQPSADARPAPEKKICTTQRDTGSRVVKQVCKTAAEREKDAEDARNRLNMGNRSTRPPDAFKAPAGG